MSDLMNTFLLAGYRFMPRMHFRLDLLEDHLLKTKKENKN